MSARNHPFNEAKATEAAARLLQLAGGRLKYLHLIKLLYIADREALRRWGRPITTDRYVSMDKGPVVSRVYGLIADEPEPHSRSFWHQHIVQAPAYDVTLAKQPDPAELSAAEEQLLDQIFSDFGHKDRFALCEETHQFPEWKDPHGGALPITYRDILRAVGTAPQEADRLADELEAVSTAQDLLSAGR